MGVNKEISVLDTSPAAIKAIEDGINDIFKSMFKPPPKLNLVQWADKYRVLPKNSAEAGPWDSNRVPPSIQPMLSISNPHVKEITVMSCVQLMKTELMINTAMFYMHQEPSPIMYVAPKLSIAEAWSKERLTASVNVTPVLRGIFADNRRDSGNTILQKQFPGGQISIVSARNPDDLAMRPVMILLFDEVDKYPVNVGAGESGNGGEGDPIAVAWGRSTTFGRRAKKIIACSPTTQGRSRVEQEFLEGNQCHYHMPCVKCGHSKEIKWEDIIIPVDESTGEYLVSDAYILCSECGYHWTEGDRLHSIDKGEWVAKRPEIKHHHSYHISSIASPFTPVETLAVEFVKAIGNPQLMKAFTNTRLAKTWREEGEQPDWELLYERREEYKIGVVPEGGLMLTMGVDVQKDGIYFEVVAWGRRKRSWSVDKGYMTGDIEDDEFKEELFTLFNRKLNNFNGIEMQVEKICVDSGYKTQAVYGLVREYNDTRVVAVKGEDSEKVSTILGTTTRVDINYNGERLKGGIELWKVGSSTIKEQLYSWFSKKRPTEEQLNAGRLYPTGFCHFPQYDEEYFKQMTAEQRMLTENSKGFEVWEWNKTRKDNHLLDCRVYARAGAAMLQIDRFNDDDWLARENYLVEKPVEKVDTKPQETERPQSRPQRQKKGWFKRK